MKFELSNTLAYFRSAPQMFRVDLSHISTKNFGAATKKYREDCGLSNPDRDAITFYTYNHLMSILSKNFTQHEPLPPWAAELGNAYLKELSSQGNRMLHYILSICTREMRHLHTSSVAPSFFSKIEADFGPKFIAFLKTKICTCKEETSVQNYMNCPPDVAVGKYIAGLARAFHKGVWSNGYGGKAWGKVADACTSFIEGKTSMEALVDTGFTLAHNGGPIFNKGMMYAGYGSAFQGILDIQRAGQIPELLLDSNVYPLVAVNNCKDLVNVIKKFKIEFPSEFRGWVDWVEVEKKGAMGKYAQYIKQQKLQHPTKPLIIKTSGGQKMKENGVFEVMPGLQVKKMQRIAA